MTNNLAVEKAAGLAAVHETRDPYKLCEYLGIVVLRHPLAELRGYYRRTLGLDFIVLADNLAAPVERFVCGHELGHAVLHQRLNRVFMDSRTFMLPDRYENQADGFAAWLCWGGDDCSATEAELAACLNVMPQNVAARLCELGL